MSQLLLLNIGRFPFLCIWNLPSLNCNETRAGSEQPKVVTRLNVLLNEHGAVENDWYGNVEGILRITNSSATSSAENQAILILR
jgi:hypothetical protein